MAYLPRQHGLRPSGSQFVPGDDSTAPTSQAKMNVICCGYVIMIRHVGNGCCFSMYKVLYEVQGWFWALAGLFSVSYR